MIGIWYVPKKNKFYAKYVRLAYFHREYAVGFENNYGHKLVAMFYICNKKLYHTPFLCYNNQSKKCTDTIFYYIYRT